MFYEDPYAHIFEAIVTDVQNVKVIENGAEIEKTELALDKTCFYPESGGQISDTGTIEGEAVEYVHEFKNVAGDYIIHHRLKKAFDLKPGATVKCSIDSELRIRNMQNHTGQHILSESFIRTHDLHTISMHMGLDYMSIDLAVSDKFGASLPKNFKLDKKIIEDAENMANSIIRKALDVKTFYVNKAELSNYKLRKTPELEDDSVRIVEIGGFDVSLCCGTHVKNTGEIGIIKVISQEKAGGAVRIKFLCACQCFEDYRKKNYILSESSEMLSIAFSDLPKTIEKINQENKAIAKSRAELFDKYFAEFASGLCAGKHIENGIYLSECPDFDFNEISKMAQIFSKAQGSFGFILIKTDQAAGTFRFILGKTASYPRDVKQIFSEISVEFSIKGGGSQLVVQGGSVETRMLADFTKKVKERLSL